ncbi:MAG: hypothetical protein U1E05_26935 [Patescibacteria group bacterium]|nr:hypothetical protein [Patescibacteria group bacterium]
MLQLLRDKDDWVRWETVQTLGELAAQPSVNLRNAVVPLLIEGLRDGRMPWEYWSRACEAVAYVGPANKDVIPALTQLMRDAKNENFRTTAAAQLGDLGCRLRPGGEDLTTIVAALAESIATEPQPDVRCSIVYALRCIGPPAKAALPALRTATEDPFKNVSDAARSAIDAIGKTKGEQRGRGGASAKAGER